MSAQDNINCLKNLLQLMCCDKIIYPAEKAFLKKAADQLEVPMDDWNGLLKEVLRDNIPFYPVSDREKAVAVLKALIIMAKSDNQVDTKEKQFVLQFAKSIGVSRSEWKTILQNTDTENLFAAFQAPSGQVLALTDDFEKLDAFLKVGADNGATVKTTALKDYLKTSPPPQAVVCFHAAPDKDLTVSWCQLLLSKTPDALVCILTRFQGHQVKYLHEAGLKKCVIEPVYVRDITDILKLL